jgi:NitT/TauT family transport system substrate-binding protein
MWTSRRALAAAVVSVGMLLLAACGGASSAGSGGVSSGGSKGGKNVTLMLNFYPYGEHAPIYYGMKTGIFARHGINLTIEAGKGSGPTAQAVGQKQVDFGWADTPNVLSAVSAGVPVKSVGVFYQSSCAAVQFFASKHITKPADLKGLKIAVTPGDAFTTAFPAFLKANGMSASDVHLVSVAASAKISTLISGQADALLGFIDDQGPTIQNKTGEQMSYLRFFGYGLKYEGTGLVANDATIKSDPQLVKQMVQAISESFTAAEKNGSAAVDAMAGASENLPPTSVLSEQWKRAQTCMPTPNTKSLPPGDDSQADWQQTVHIFQSLGQIKSGLPVSEFWDGSYAPAS